MRGLHILLALAMAIPALASAEEHKPGECYQKTITVCVPKKPKKKKAAVVAAPPTGDVVVPPLVVPPVQVTITPVVTRVVKVPEPCNRPHVEDCINEQKPQLGIYGELGVGVRDQYYQANLGLRLTIPKARLAIQAFSVINRGVGFQALIYPYRGKRVQVHILDPGAQITGFGVFDSINNTDVPRKVDLIFGAGVDINLKCNLKLLVDWRVNLADPVYLAQEDGKLYQTGPNSYKYLDAAHVTGNSFSSSMLMVGLLYDLPLYKKSK